VPKKVREDLKIIPLQHMDQVLEMALATEATLEPPKPRKRQEDNPQEEE
jgi:ATP-dependent Lon protease